MNFLKGFTPDGYCGEGTGYWNYGFGHYVFLAEEIRLATGGQIDLLARKEAWRRPRSGRGSRSSTASTRPSPTPRPATVPRARSWIS